MGSDVFVLKYKFSFENNEKFALTLRGLSTKCFRVLNNNWRMRKTYVKLSSGARILSAATPVSYTHLDVSKRQHYA